MYFNFLNEYTFGKDVKGFKIEELGQIVIQPIRFHGHVIRKLSDWCSVVPDISIDAELPSLEVQLGPGDYSCHLVSWAMVCLPHHLLRERERMVTVKVEGEKKNQRHLLKQ